MNADNPQTTEVENTPSGRRRASWKPEFDDVLRADWLNGVSLGEFGARFGYSNRKNGAAAVRKNAIRLGLLKP